MNASSSYSSDVATLDAILHAMYDVISGPKGQPRDWDRLRNLYHPSARLIPVLSPPGEAVRPRVMSAEEYIERVAPIFETEDFWECESDRKTEQFGAVAHVLSAYETRRSADGPADKHGSNSVQLFFDGTRWWIVNVMWNTHRTA